MPTGKEQNSKLSTAGDMAPTHLLERNLADDEEVRQLAYQFWQERGCPTDSPEEDWFRAEREARHNRSPGTKQDL